MSSSRPDLVHAHWTYEFAEAALRTGLPHVMTMHDLAWENLWHFRDAYRLMRLVMTYRTMPRVRQLTVVTPFMANKARIYGYAGPVAVIPNGIALPDPVTISRQAKSPINIVTVGNGGRMKNVAASLRAFRVIREHCPTARLHLFGPGLDAAFAAGAPGVVGHGNVDHAALLDFLAKQARLLIHPSRFETFGVVIAEAMARGVPVVAGHRSGGVSHVVGTGPGRSLVDIEDPGAIASAALALLASMDVDAMSAAIRQHVADRFNAAVVSAQHASLYARIVDAGP